MPMIGSGVNWFSGHIDDGNPTCRHCPSGHGNIVCDCGHHHNDHISLGGCIHRNDTGQLDCGCEGYSQRKLRQNPSLNPPTPAQSEEETK